jgi:hypothetical protein
MSLQLEALIGGIAMLAFAGHVHGDVARAVAKWRIGHLDAVAAFNVADYPPLSAKFFQAIDLIAEFAPLGLL